MGQQPGQVRAHDPAAAHLARRALKIAGPEAQTGENLPRFGLQAVAAQLVKTVMNVIMDIFRVQCLDRMIGLPGFEDTAQFGVLRRDGGGQLDDSFITCGRVLLWQIAEGNAAFEGDLASVGLLVAQDDREKRGLAGAIRSHQANAILSIDLERGIGEQDPFAVGFCEAGQRQHEGKKLPQNQASRKRKKRRPQPH